MVQEDRVRTALYTDDAVFEDELERIWYRTWVFVGHESEIAEPNEFVTRRIGRLSVIVVRDRTGELRVHLNRCTHRGNTVCQEERGVASVFRCAYHGWCFNNTGDLIGATFPEGYGADFYKVDHGLRPIPRVASYAGFVFASVAPEGPDLVSHLGNAREFLDQLVSYSPEGRIECRSGIIKSRLHGNWKFPIENAVDGYHPAFLHKSVMVDRGTRDVKVAEDSTRSRDLGNGHGALDFTASNRITLAGATESRVPVVPVAPDLEDANQRHRELLIDRYGPDRGDRVFGDGLSNLSIFPNLALVRGDVRMVVPVTAGQTLMYQFPATFPGAPEAINRERLRWEVAAYGAAGMVGADDAEVYERNQEGLLASLDDWVLLSRGLADERDDGPDGRSSALADESSQRAFWRHYRKLMCAA
jgi:phenylpropionate dioxygenase-like ring-hydroxylating dioxygenase large terminal subunit